jgi:REP element-mobilizing transposase RayT
MVFAYHIVLSTYGFWLPNDPRGSWSDFVAAWELVRFGKATKVTTRRSAARAEHNTQHRLAAKRLLRFPPVQFTGRQALAVGRGFARASDGGGYVIHACAILPEHAHLVLARCDRRIQQVVGHLKAEATRQLNAEGLHPSSALQQHSGHQPSQWAEGGWKVYLDSPGAVAAAVQYVERNPLKEGKRLQRWSFVTLWQ